MDATPGSSPFDPATLRVLDTMPEPVWLAHADGRIAFVNAKGLALLGMTAERVVEDGWQHLLHPDERDEVLERVAHTVRTGEPFAFEGRLLAGSGAYTWIRSSAQALRDGHRIVGFVGHLIDIGRYRAAELQAREAEAELRDARNFNETLLDTMPIMFWSADAHGRAQYFNRWFFEYTGMTPDDTGDGRYWNAMHPDDRAGAAERWAQLRAAARPADRFARYRRGSDGSWRWHLVHARPMRDASGAVVRWFGYSLDVDDQRRAAERQHFLLSATGALGALLDPEQLYETLVAQCVPSMADSAVVLLVEGPELRVAAAAAVDAARLADVRRFHDAYAWGRADGPIRQAFATGEPVLLGHLTQPQLDVLAESDDQRALLAALGTRSSIVTPLFAGDDIAGVLITSYGPSERRYDENDVQALQLLSERLATILSNVQRFEREHRVAEALQAASLPQRLPSARGLSLFAYYAAARSEATIGGDWYDAFELRDGRVVLSIGDVTGRGLDAAVTMANVRQILRGIGHVHADPALMLQAADRALRAEHPDTYVTALACVVDTPNGTVTYASAGHPPAALRRRGGDVSMLTGPGLPLGMRSQDEPDAVTLPLRDGDALVLYTDGLSEVERRPRDGEEAIVAEVRRGDIFATDDPARALYDRLVGDRARDDVAILVAYVGDPRDGSFSSRHGLRAT
jgi:PAS domain S-box-containing protein